MIHFVGIDMIINKYGSLSDSDAPARPQSNSFI